MRYTSGGFRDTLSECKSDELTRDRSHQAPCLGFEPKSRARDMYMVRLLTLTVTRTGGDDIYRMRTHGVRIP